MGRPESHAHSNELAALNGEAGGYPVTGDVSFSVELINHEDTDWAQNLAGMRAILSGGLSRPDEI